MSQQNQINNSVPPLEFPANRKRGRPRKDESHRTAQHVEVPVGKYCNDTEMMGQMVHGVIEETFDAGYIISVKVGDSNTLLSGCVFKPGRFTPITPDNNVAPQATMCARTKFPIPAHNIQSPNGSINPQPKTNNDNKPFGSASVLFGSTSDFASNDLGAFEKTAPNVSSQTAKVSLPPLHNVSIAESSENSNFTFKPVAEQKGVPEFGVIKQDLKDASIIHVPGIVMDSSRKDLYPKIDIRESQDLNLDPVSKWGFDIFPENQIISRISQVRHPASDYELKTPNLELQLTSAVADETKPVQVDIFMDNVEFDVLDNNLSGDGISENRKPVSILPSLSEEAR